MPRLAWPSSIARCLSSGSAGLNSIPPSAFNATATIAAPAVNASPSRVCTSTCPSPLATAATGVASRRSKTAASAIAASSAPVPPSIVTRPPVNWVSSRL